MLQTKAAAAGTAGSAFKAVLSYAAKAAGTYTFTEANFAGLGAYLPGFATIAVVPNAGMTGDLQISTDNGTTWKSLLKLAATATAGTVQTGSITVYLDTATTFRANYAGGTADFFIFPFQQGG
jgi:hypothetical protein